MIEISQVTKKYSNFTAVNQLSLSIGKGEIFGFLGVNGAGKTTTIKMMVGILRPTSGEISIAGHNLSNDAIAAKRITGYIPDRPYIYPKLTAKEFLYFVCDLYGVGSNDANKRIDQLLEEYALKDWQNELVESFSHGMKQRLATCAALVHKPKVLIVDEPMVGLDPHGAKFLKDAFRRYAKEGMSIFLSTHSLNVAEEVADRLAIIHRGELITMGTLAAIREKTGQLDQGLENLFLQLTSNYLAQ
jgi:ABC-2 type transport system ATP-binding protein